MGATLTDMIGTARITFEYQRPQHAARNTPGVVVNEYLETNVPEFTLPAM